LTWGRGNLQPALQEMQELGLQHFETFGDNLMYDTMEHEEPGRFKSLVESSGLLLVAFYCGHMKLHMDGCFEEIQQDFLRWTRAARSFGAQTLVVSGGKGGPEEEREKDVTNVANNLNRLGRMTLDEGVRIAYHMHYGQTVDREWQLDQLMALTDPEIIGFAPDIGQIAKGEADPAAVYDKYADRVSYIHMKDLVEGRAGGDTNFPTDYAELGLGIIDIPAVIERMAAHSF